MTHITTKSLTKIAALVCALTLSVIALTGCAAGQETKTPQELNRAYMASVSQSIEDLGTELDAFVTAVGENDLAAMKIANDRAAKAMDNIANLTPSEALAPVHDEYVAGVTDLQDALGAYVDLYSQVEAGTLSSADLKASLTNVQKTYDNGIKHLEKGDSLVVELAGPQDKDSKAADASEDETK